MHDYLWTRPIGIKTCNIFAVLFFLSTIFAVVINLCLHGCQKIKLFVLFCPFFGTKKICFRSKHFFTSKKVIMFSWCRFRSKLCNYFLCDNLKFCQDDRWYIKKWFSQQRNKHAMSHLRDDRVKAELPHPFSNFVFSLALRFFEVLT